MGLTVLQSEELTKKAAIYRRMAVEAADASARDTFLEWAERFEMVAAAMSEAPPKVRPETVD